MRKEFEHMKRCDINKLLHERFPNTWLHLALCCFRYGPALKHREDRHCGEHTQNIRCCIESLGISSLMKECHKGAMELWASGVNNIRVTCICDGGMHASVTVAAILQNVYHQRGYNSKGPYHIDPSPRMCWNCGVPAKCCNGHAPALLQHPPGPSSYTAISPSSPINKCQHP